MSSPLELQSVYFFHGLAFVFWAAAVFWLRPKADDKAPWFWLALAAFSAAVGQWIGMLAPSFGHTAAFGALHTVAAALPLGFLTEFARRALRPDPTTTRRGPATWLASRWVYLPLGLAVALVARPAGGLTGDWAALEAACRYVFGLAGIFPAAYVLARCARRGAGEERTGFWIAAAALAIYAIPAGLVVGRADFLPASVVNEEAFRNWFAVPVDIARAACALAMAAGLWLVRCARLEGKARPGRAARWMTPAACAAVVVLGWMMTPWDYQRSDLQVAQGGADAAAASPTPSSATAESGKSNSPATKDVSLARQKSNGSTILLVLLVQGVIAGLCLLAYRFSR